MNGEQRPFFLIVCHHIAVLRCQHADRWSADALNSLTISTASDNDSYNLAMLDQKKRKKTVNRVASVQ